VALRPGPSNGGNSTRRLLYLMAVSLRVCKRQVDHSQFARSARQVSLAQRWRTCGPSARRRPPEPCAQEAIRLDQPGCLIQDDIEGGECHSVCAVGELTFEVGFLPLEQVAHDSEGRAKLRIVTVNDELPEVVFGLGDILQSPLQLAEFSRHVLAVCAVALYLGRQFERDLPQVGKRTGWDSRTEVGIPRRTW